MELSDKNLTLYYKDKVTTADCDVRSRLRLGGFVNLLVQAAIVSADNLGFGFGGLREQKLFWVLRSLTLEINRSVKWKEEVEVETWPKNIDGIQYLRDFFIRSSSGEVLGKATSSWLAIDFDHKRPKRVSGSEAEAFVYLKDKFAIENPPVKLDFAVEGEPRNITPTFFDLDLNGHVTTTRYIDWMMDSLGVEMLMDSFPRQLSITFLRETLITDKIEIRCCDCGSGVYRFEGYNTVQNVVGFRGEIVF